MSTLRVGYCFQVESLADRRAAPELNGLDLLILPELADGGYAALAGGAPPHQPADPYFSSFKELTRQHPLCCVAGSACVTSSSGRRTNSSLVFQRGRMIHRYDKIHLFRPTGDTKFFSPGESFSSFTFRAGGRRLRAGVVICYDLRFPELVRAIAREGVQLLVVPARWPAIRDEAWQALLKARAIENQLFVLGCNALGAEGGYSYAFDPLGQMVFSSRKRKGKSLLSFALDLEALKAARRLHNNLREAVLLHKTSFPTRLKSP